MYAGEVRICNAVELSVDGPQPIRVRVANCFAFVISVRHDRVTQIVLTVVIACCVVKQVLVGKCGTARAS